MGKDDYRLEDLILGLAFDESDADTRKKILELLNSYIDGLEGQDGLNE